jgi:hypothetical protein
MTGSIDAKVEQRIDALLKGAIDPHVHSGPSIAPRGIGHIELLRQASQVGFAAVVAKDHDCSSAMTAALIKKHASLNDVKARRLPPWHQAPHGPRLRRPTDPQDSLDQHRTRDRHRGSSGSASRRQDQL